VDPQRWARIESLYHAAFEKGPGERAGHLAEACVDEPELKREVESLLACANTELKSPLATGERWLSSFRMGLYEMIEALGTGGMGGYRARDTRLLHEVAIKVCRAHSRTIPRHWPPSSVGPGSSHQRHRQLAAAPKKVITGIFAEIIQWRLEFS
jgi:hypothetical protein